MSDARREIEGLDLAPMVTPRSNMVHGVPVGRSADDPVAFALCSLARVEALVPAVGDNLRASAGGEVMSLDWSRLTTFRRGVLASGQDAAAGVSPR